MTHIQQVYISDSKNQDISKGKKKKIAKLESYIYIHPLSARIIRTILRHARELRTFVIYIKKPKIITQPIQSFSTEKTYVTHVHTLYLKERRPRPFFVRRIIYPKARNNIFSHIYMRYYYASKNRRLRCCAAFVYITISMMCMRSESLVW